MKGHHSGVFRIEMIHFNTCFHPRVRLSEGSVGILLSDCRYVPCSLYSPSMCTGHRQTHVSWPETVRLATCDATLRDQKYIRVSLYFAIPFHA